MIETPPSAAELRKFHQSKKRQNPETSIMLSCLAFLNVLPGVKAWRQNTGAMKIDDRFVRFGVKGMSDIAGIVAPEGKALAVEVKVPGEEPDADQQEWLAMVLNAGGIAFVVHSIDECMRQATLWGLT